MIDLLLVNKFVTQILEASAKKNRLVQKISACFKQKFHLISPKQKIRTTRGFLGCYQAHWFVTINHF
jgi:GR25 family glycosyltransferase involved in LPS biosynthesis